MIICAAIRKTNSERTVCVLLTTYLRTLQSPKDLPEGVTALPLSPITGLKDIRVRLEKLAIESKRTNKPRDSSGFDVVGEAMIVFDVAVRRIAQISGEGGDQFFGGRAA